MQAIVEPATAVAPDATGTKTDTKIHILYDFDPEGDFFASKMREHIAEASGREVLNHGELCVQPNNFINKWRRALHNLTFGIRTRNEIGPDDHVICWNQNIGIALALWWRLTGTGKNQSIYITCTTNTPIRQRFPFKQILNYAFGSKNFRYYVANNVKDITGTPELYSNIAKGDKVTLIFFSSDIDFEGKSAELPELAGQDYFISTGRSNRKYSFFIDFFEKNPQYDYKIICDNLKQSTDAKNIDILRTVYGAENYAYVRGARAVLLDLKDKNAAAGNTVFVQTMELGIPIVMTRCKVLEDYAIDGKNCILIDADDHDQLKAALEKLQDDAFCAEMSAFQKQDHAERFSMRGVARKFAEATLT